jgi:hypothetical protein
MMLPYKKSITSINTITLISTTVGTLALIFSEDA